ncbi:MAG: murein biosynthesis integral membrane protein MurJ [Acidimicrobiales bacterium]
MSDPPRSFPAPTRRAPGPSPPARGARPAPPAGPGVGRLAQLDRASVFTAAGTLLSRLSGLVRLVVLAGALGGASLATGFNLANNTPNMVHDLVLGGVLAATFVPVFVDRLASRSREEAVESISAVVTLSLVVLVATSVLLAVLAPQVVGAYTAGAAAASPPARAVAVELLRWFAPQVFFYGAVSLMSAVLATRDRFAVVGIVPVLNNVVNVGVLVAFAVASRHLAVAGTVPIAAVQHDQSLVTLLGLGTTLGVALQALALVPSMRRCGIRLRLVWRPGDPAVRTIVALSGWTFGFVAANQIAVFVVLALEYHLGGGSVSAYTYAYQFFVFPFAVVAVSVINVASPDMARSWASGDVTLMGQQFARATRQTLALVLPAAIGYLLLARPAMVLLLQHGAEHHADAELTASVLAMFALGLPGFSVFFLATRAFQAMQDTRTAFVCYALENGTNVLLAFVLYTPLGVRGLALAYSVAYTLAAIVALAVLRERIGRIGGRTLLLGAGRAVILSLVMAFAVAFVSALLGDSVGLVGWAKLVAEVLTGALVYLGGAGAAGSLSAWQTSRRTRHGGRSHARGARARSPGRH